MMGDPKTVLEGCVKYRDKKKWKARWAVVSKLSPVADCLHLQLYRDSKERCKNGPTKASLSLEGFLGMETGFTLDKESNTMALICSEIVVVLAFDSRELLIQWQVKIRANLVEEQQFLVQIVHIPAKSKLSCGPARLHLQDHKFCLVAGVPPRLLSSWPIKELRRFGVVDGKFCFEGGSHCGRGEGLHVLLTNQSEELSQAMDLASKGKLLGKRKTLSRKNSVLETSTRMSLHKSHRRDSDKCSTDSCRPLLSSGSEGSTCDACSEILRSSDPLGTDESYASKSGCRIHYRWPSCVSRWGQGSTTTTSDVESMDTVSVTLSDFQSSVHCSTISKISGHGQSLSCLCDGQGTWPLSHCSRCGRHFYSKSNLHQNGGQDRSVSPDVQTGDCASEFSPQWTMDLMVVSPSSEAIVNSARKDGSYQGMKPSSDRTSLCSHASHSSSASTASSSGSEYSVPRNYLESLYDKPSSVHQAVKNCGLTKSSLQTPAERRLSCANKSEHAQTTEKNVLCPCHEPASNWPSSLFPAADHPSVHAGGSTTCLCWNKLTMPSRSGKDVRPVSSGAKSASANPSPSTSPKKIQFSSASNTMRQNGNNLVSSGTSKQIPPCTCHEAKNGAPYTNYDIPRTALANLYLKEKQAPSAQMNGTGDCSKSRISGIPTEEYDVPRKFADILTNSELLRKASSAKTIGNVPVCSCRRPKKVTQQSTVIHGTETRVVLHRHHHPSSNETVQMCTCQRVMLWAGSLVPCLGASSSNATDSGWQCGKSINQTEVRRDQRASSRMKNNLSAVCCEPPRTAEVVLTNGKTKHFIHKELSNRLEESRASDEHLSELKSGHQSPRGQENGLEDGQNCSGCNYVNIEFPMQTSVQKDIPQTTDDSVNTNYANLEFVETLPLYENSTCVLSRLDHNELVSPEKPPLPPRGVISSSEDVANHTSPCDCRKQICNHKQNGSPKHLVNKDMTSSTYELMCFQKHDPEDDYLLMQPLYTERTETSPLDDSESKPALPSENAPKDVTNGVVPDLPLRPFMPISFPSQEDGCDGTQVKSPSDPNAEDLTSFGGRVSDLLSRKHQLMSEEIKLRSARSNSLSDLKKKVLMRKRSSSVDGKNNVVASESQSSSPLSSPKPSIQRKNSLFSKLTLRSKEKSMSTNEIVPPETLPTVQSSAFLNYHKTNLHRSADCLKLNEEYSVSDDEVTSSELGDQVTSTIKTSKSGTSMKRSSSVPCRSAMPANIPSPEKTNGVLVMHSGCRPADNDVYSPEKSPKHINDNSETLQRKYSLDSHERPKRTLHKVYSNVIKTNCDSVSGKHDCYIERDSFLECEEIARTRQLSITPPDRSILLDACRSTTSSSSSSDMSDYIESLSFCSRSSSSSSGSCDFLRTEDLLCLQKAAKAPHSSFPKHTSTNSINATEHTPQLANHHHHYHHGSPMCCSLDACRPFPTQIIAPPSTTATQRTKRDSRSSTSSTSSLSTSPSIADYSSSPSSSSGKSSLSAVTASNIAEERGFLMVGTSSGKFLEPCAEHGPIQTPACTKKCLPESNLKSDGSHHLNRECS